VENTIELNISGVRICLCKKLNQYQYMLNIEHFYLIFSSGYKSLNAMNMTHDSASLLDYLKLNSKKFFFLMNSEKAEKTSC